MDELTSSQQDALNEFVVVTGLSLDESETQAKALALLSHHNYDLNNSVLAYFDKGFDLPNLDRGDFETSSSEVFSNRESFLTELENSDVSSYRNLQGDFAMMNMLPKLARAPRISNKWQLDLGIHVSRKAFRNSEEDDSTEGKKNPKRLPFLWIILLIIPKTLSLVLSAFRHLLGLNFTVGMYDQPRLQFNFDNYEENYDAKQSLLDEDIMSTYDISTEHFNECYDSSQQNIHFLLGVLCDDRSVDFVRNMLRGQRFKDLFSTATGQYKETQIWVNNIDKSPEAFEVAAAYHRRRLPFVFLIGNVSRDPSVMSSMSVIYKANCALGDEEEQDTLLRKVSGNLNRTLNDYNPQLVAKRFDKQEIEMSRFLKDQQDEAYLESLQNDKVKKIEKEKKRLESESQKRSENLRKNFIQHLISTKYFENQTEGLSASDIVRISIKLPDGRRVIQKFPKSGMMGEIYVFVETLLVDEIEENKEESSEMIMADFLKNFDFTFELFVPLPKSCLPKSTESIREFKKLNSGDSVFFEYIDSEEVSAQV